jgi:lipopolysaccharide export system ATP-binding protein
MKHRLPKAESSTSRIGSKSPMEQAELLIDENKSDARPDAEPKRSGPPPLPVPVPPETPVNEPPSAETGATVENDSYGFIVDTPGAEAKPNGDEAPVEIEPRRATPPPLPAFSRIDSPTPPPLPLRMPPPLPFVSEEKPVFAAGGSLVAETPPASEVVPAIIDETPATAEPIPVIAENTPTGPEPLPAVVEEMPAMSDPSSIENAPASLEPVPGSVEILKLTKDTTPITVEEEVEAPEPADVPVSPAPPPLFTPKPILVAEAVAESNGQHAPYLIQTQGLVKQYGGRRVVNGVDIHVRAGEVVGLLGKNGAGKTTTFYMIVGLVPPTLGHVFMGDEDVTHMPMYRRARRGIGYLPQEESIFRKLTVEENLLAILETLPMTEDEREIRCDELLKDFGLEHVRENVAITLSGGEKRRVTIARALVTSPSLLLLDEPFSGVDPMAVHDIQEIILHLKERGLGVLITDHNVRETLSVVDRAYIIDEGRVLSEGTREFLLNDPIAREIYLGHRFSM